MWERVKQICNYRFVDFKNLINPLYIEVNTGFILCISMDDHDVTGGFILMISL